MNQLCLTMPLVVNPSRIAFLKFILEGYDGMAILTTIEPKAGKVIIRYIPSFEEVLDELLLSLNDKIKPITP